MNLLSVVLYHPATRTKYSPYLPGGLVPSNLQVIDLPANLAVPNSLYFVNVSVANNKLLYGPQVRITPFCLLSITNFLLLQPYALVVTGQTTYLPPFYQYKESDSSEPATYISSGAVTYIAVQKNHYSLCFLWPLDYVLTYE